MVRYLRAGVARNRFERDSEGRYNDGIRRDRHGSQESDHAGRQECFRNVAAERSAGGSGRRSERLVELRYLRIGDGSLGLGFHGGQSGITCGYSVSIAAAS